MQAYKARGYFVEAPNLTDLAAKLGINPQALGATVTEWHTVYDTKKDPVFGRKDSIFTRIDTAPYYGQKYRPPRRRPMAASCVMRRAVPFGLTVR